MQMRIHMHMCIQMRMRMCMQMQMQMQMCTHARTHARTHAHTHAHTHRGALTSRTCIFRLAQLRQRPIPLQQRHLLAVDLNTIRSVLAHCLFRNAAIGAGDRELNFCIHGRRKTPFDPSAPRPSALPETGTARSALALRPTTTRSQELAWVQHEKSTDLSQFTQLHGAGTGARRPSLWRCPIPNATAGTLCFRRPFFGRPIFRQVPPLYREANLELP